jgi:GNAT superfamily N-acetyltransferase
MSIQLTPLDPETDLQRVVELISYGSCEPLSVERYRSLEKSLPRGTVRFQVVATLACRRIVGFAEIVHQRCMPAGYFHFRLIVDRDERGRGIGGMLYDDLLLFAREQGATRLSVDVLTSATEGLRFATTRGFTVATGDSETPDCPDDYYRLVRDLS